MKKFTILVFALVSILALQSSALAQPFAGQQKGAKSATAKELSLLEKSFEKAKVAYKVKGAKSTASVKKAFTDAGYAFGYASMTSAALPTSVKYKQALKIFKEVLDVDPKHAQAKSQRDLIISIYKQMGRPIPQ